MISLWSDLTKAIKQSDMDSAKAAKEKVEDEQRELAKEREKNNKEWQGRFFEREYEDIYSFKGKDLYVH